MRESYWLKVGNHTIVLREVSQSSYFWTYSDYSGCFQASSLIEAQAQAVKILTAEIVQTLELLRVHTATCASDLDWQSRRD